MGRAYEVEQSPAGARRDRADSHQLAHVRRRPPADLPGHRHRGGVRARWAWACAGMRSADLEAMINEGVRRAYLNPDNKLRASIVADPAFKRGNTRDNTPAVIHTEFVPGDERRDHGGRQGRRFGEQIHVRDAEPVGFGGRLGARDGAGDGRRLVPARHARRRHRRQRREGHAAREEIADGAHRHRRSDRARARRPSWKSCASRSTSASMRSASARKGLGGSTTVLDVKVLDYPTHAASLAGGGDPELRRHPPRSFHSGRHGPALLEPPDLDLWPKVQWTRRMPARGASRSMA